MFLIDDGIKLNADLEMPDANAEKCPLVIIIHGFTGYNAEPHLLAVSEMLHAIGYATLRVDMYGHGKSEGKFHDHTLYKWLTNAMTAVDYARSLNFVTDIYLCGHSQGGLTVMLAGAMEHDRIKGIIALSPAAMIPDLARKGGLLGTGFDPDNIPEDLTVWNDFVLGNNYVRVAQTIDVDSAIDRYTGPVLVVQGDQDGEDLMASAVAAAKRYKNAKLVMIQGAPHCYDEHFEELADAVKGWMPKLS
ncbi:MAG: lysophospholipase [Lachnospiraceae bacterium]|nr:lysophospholipase [Lachnospiraceae bacterium]